MLETEWCICTYEQDNVLWFGYNARLNLIVLIAKKQGFITYATSKN